MGQTRRNGYWVNLEKASYMILTFSFKARSENPIRILDYAVVGENLRTKTRERGKNLNGKSCDKK